MNRFAQTAFALVISVLIAAGSARAHPHVWVTVKSEVVYAASGVIIGVRHAWTFDDMFSTFATQGLKSEKGGMLSREELQPLAQVNVEALKDSEYFSYVKINGKKAAFGEPKDYYFEHKDSLLTLRFLLPLKIPVETHNLELEVFDPVFFVDFTFHSSDPAMLVGAPSQCKISVAKRSDTSTPPNLGLRFGPQLPFGPLNPDTWGAQGSNKILVKCP